jgi:hypothetical protein
MPVNNERNVAIEKSSIDVVRGMIVPPASLYYIACGWVGLLRCRDTLEEIVWGSFEDRECLMTFQA